VSDFLSSPSHNHVTAPSGNDPASGSAGAVAGGFAERFGALVDNVERVIRGKREVVSLALTCLLAEGHLLIEDVPGVGKTSLARCLAASVQGSWHRIQFTPDLLPSDVTGVSIYNQATNGFEFHPGAVFANLIVADEINRASPKTQSALLEVMEERLVTVDARRYPVPRPFMVIATQNPIDMDGTYALPEAQLDRFLMRLEVGYPDHAAEVEVLVNHHAGRHVEALNPVMTVAEVEQMVRAGAQVHVAPAVHDYIVRIAAATRTAEGVRLGASPRGSVALLRAARAKAACDGRGYVVPDDVKSLAVPVLAHRLVLTPDAEVRGRTGAEAVTEAVRAVPVPRTLAGA